MTKKLLRWVSRFLSSHHKHTRTRRIQPFRIYWRRWRTRLTIRAPKWCPRSKQLSATNNEGEQRLRPTQRSQIAHSSPISSPPKPIERFASGILSPTTNTNDVLKFQISVVHFFFLPRKMIAHFFSHRWSMRARNLLLLYGGCFGSRLQVNIGQYSDII